MNSKLKNAANQYLEKLNIARLKARKEEEPSVKELKLSQILYSNVQIHAIFCQFPEYIEKEENKLFECNLFLDSWELPECDKKNIINTQKESLQKGMNNLIKNMKWIGHVSVNDVIYLLEEDRELRDKKRFIDTIACILRHALLNTENQGQEIINMFEKNSGKLGFFMEDITDFKIAHFEKRALEL